MQNTQTKHLFPAVASIIILCGVCINALALPVELLPDSTQQQMPINALEQLQVEGLKRALAINAKLSTKMALIIKTNKQRRAVLENTYQEQMAELNKIIDKASSKEIAVHVSQLEQTSKELQALYMQKWKALKPLLTDKQQARYLIYQDALQRELQRRVIEGLDRSVTGR